MEQNKTNNDFRWTDDEASCFCKLVWNTKLKKNIKDSAGKV